MRGYVEKELHVPENQSLKTLRNMSKDEYNKHVLQIQEWMKDEEEWKNGYSIKSRYGIPNVFGQID